MVKLAEEIARYLRRRDVEEELYVLVHSLFAMLSHDVELEIGLI